MTRSPARPDSPLWPERLRILSDRLRGRSDPQSRDKALGEAWLLLNSSISRYLRIHAAHLGRLAREELEDIAAEKSLDLLRRIEEGTWDMTGRGSAEIKGFLSNAARNGLVDQLRRTGRRVVPKDENRPEWDVNSPDRESRMNGSSVMSATDSADILVERKEFAVALRNCADQLGPRARLAWFFRVFCQMSSKEIASHPELTVKPSQVDVLLQRTRQTIRECMRSKGYESHDMPPGTFIELWRAFRLDMVPMTTEQLR